MTLVIADVSEFQPNIDWAAYGAEHPAAIIRAHSGGRPDKWWAHNAAGAAQHCRWWAAYQYLRANDDPAADARAFLKLLDALSPERRPSCTIVDIEEGAGDQQLRQHRWLAVMADDPARDWTYAGDYFARSHGLTVEWVAAYQQREPSVAHVLWQNTDRQTFAGIVAPCDGSIFHGSIDDLIALTGGSPAPAPIPVHQEEDMGQITDPDQIAALARIDNGVADLIQRVGKLEDAVGEATETVETGLAGSLHKARRAIKAGFSKLGVTGDIEAKT